jgi:hypothetical protein
MAIPESVVKYAFQKAGSVIGGDLGAKIAALGANTAFLEADGDELAQKIADGTATSGDIARFSGDLAGELLIGWGAVAAAGLAEEPGALITTGVFIGAAAGLYEKNPTAFLDGADALADSWGQQPWTILRNVANAYSARKNNNSCSLATRFEKPSSLTTTPSPPEARAAYRLRSMRCWMTSGFRRLGITCGAPTLIR